MGLGSNSKASYQPRALVRGCGQVYALQTVEPVTYRCVRDGSAKLGHPVQNVTREHGLTPLPR